MNKLFYGDNLIIMRKMVADSVDLIYLDPPFNSNRSYNLLYKNTTGLPIPEQIEAFCDTRELDYEKPEMAYEIPNIMQKYCIQNDVVFDPFCGCGTTIEASIRNHRKRPGCDIAIHSIKLIQETRIKKYSLTKGKDYTIEGVPQSTEQAKHLFGQDPVQFQHWAVEKTIRKDMGQGYLSI